MAIKRNETPEDPIGSLDDSAYELLGDVSSDDEEYDGTTESLASAEDDTPYDLASNAATEINREEAISEVPETGAAFEVPVNHEHDKGKAPTDSELTARVSLSSSIIGSREATRTPAPDRITTVHTLTSFDEPDMPDALRQYNSDHINLTIRQTLARTHYALDGPFRVLYVGAQWARSDITRKIAAAIDMSGIKRDDSQGDLTEAMPFCNIAQAVPLDDYAADANIKRSSHVEIIVDEVSSTCTTAEDDISVTLNDQTVVKSLNDWVDPRRPRRDGAIPSAASMKEGHVLPHIAIFFAAKDTDMQMSEKILHTTDAMSHHSVPIIYVAEEPFRSLTLHSIQTEYEEVHMCVEARTDDGKGNEILRRLPLDLATFLSLDNGRLNRNLACITAVSEQPGILSSVFGQPLIRMRQSAMIADLKKRLNEVYQVGLHQTRPAQWAGMVVLLSTLFLLVFSTLQPRGTPSSSLSHVESHSFFGGHQPYSQISSTSFPGTSSTLSSKAVQTSSTLSSNAVRSATKRPEEKATKALSVTENNRSISNAVAKFANSLSLISANRDVSVLPTKEEAAKVPPNKSNRFKVSTVGNSHLLVVAPEMFARAKKAPQLFAQTIIKDTPVDMEVAKITNGVYAITVPKQISYGPLNLTIWTQSKPLLKQSFEVQLGSSMNGSLRSAAERIAHLAKWQSDMARDLVVHAQRNVRPALSALQLRSSSTWNATMGVLKQGIDACASRANHVSNQTKSVSISLLHDVEKRSASTSTALIKQSRLMSAEFGNVMRGLNKTVRSLDRTAVDLERVISKQVSTIVQKAVSAERNFAKYISEAPSPGMAKTIGKARERALSLWKRFSARKAERKQRRKHAPVTVSARNAKTGSKRGRK